MLSLVISPSHVEKHDGTAFVLSERDSSFRSGVSANNVNFGDGLSNQLMYFSHALSNLLNSHSASEKTPE